MKTNLSESLKAGLVYGIVTIFLFLIGFTGTAAEIIGKLLHLGGLAVAVRLAPAMLNLMIFLALMGILAGSAGAGKLKGKEHVWGALLLRSSLSGLVLGVMLAGVVYLVGSLNANGVRMSGYLPQLLPDAIHQM